MAISSSGHVLTKPVEWAEIASILGISEQVHDLGTLCQHANINQWSRHKPVRLNKWGELTDQDFANANFGMSVTTYNVATGAVRAGVTYLKPRGLSYNEQFRSFDFDGYINQVMVSASETCQPPVRTPSLQTYNINGTSSIDFGAFCNAAGDTYSFSIFEMSAYLTGTWYPAFMLLCDDDTYYLVTSSTAITPPSEGQTYTNIISLPNLYSAGIVRRTGLTQAYFLLCNTQVSSWTQIGSLTAAGRFMPLPMSNGSAFDVKIQSGICRSITITYQLALDETETYYETLNVHIAATSADARRTPVATTINVSKYFYKDANNVQHTVTASGSKTYGVNDEITGADISFAVNIPVNDITELWASVGVSPSTYITTVNNTHWTL